MPERNPHTEKAHRKDVLLQITLPMLVGVLVVAALTVSVASGTASDLSRWSQVAVIWLLLPVLLLSLIFLALLVALIYAIALLLGATPHYAYLAQYWVDRVDRQVRKGANMAVEPVIRFRSAQAGWRRLFRNKGQASKQISIANMFTEE